MNKKSLQIAFTIFILNGVTGWATPTIDVPVCQPIATLEDAVNIFPRSTKQLDSWTSTIKNATQKTVKTIIDIPAKDRTFDNTVRAFDALKGNLNNFLELLIVMVKVNPSAAIQESCYKTYMTLAPLSTDLSSNQQLSQACKEYRENYGMHEKLNAEERYFLEEAIKNFKRNGTDLTPRKLAEVTTLKNKLDNQSPVSIETQLDQKLSLSEADLAGVYESRLASLPVKNKTYTLTLNPQRFSEINQTYRTIQETCTVEQTRKRLFLALNTHKQSHLDTKLKTFVQERNKLANNIGYQDFAALTLESTMVKSPHHAIAFLEKTIQTCVKEGQKELALLKKNLPASITLDSQGNINPWDYNFVRNTYIEKIFNIDHYTVSEHLPLNHVLTNMFSIFGTFFGLTFIEVSPSWRWHDSVRLIEIHENATKKCLGYLFFDLIARDSKSSGNCCFSLINALGSSTTNNCAIGIIITNFNMNNNHEKRLQHHQVVSLFHEFGHAMHAILARPALANHGALHAKVDFLEFPSQLFEEWVFHEPVLAQLSSHHKTNKPLSKAIINAIISYQNFNTWKAFLARCMCSLFILTLFTETTNHAHPYLLWESLQKQFIPDECLKVPLFWYYDTHNTIYDRLYGPANFGYAWSQKYAAEAFQIIKKAGFSNPAMGNKLRNMVLSKGSGADPAKLLHDFLGYKPSF